jgi:hypothetical protein
MKGVLNKRRWAGYFVYRKECLKTTWRFRFAIFGSVVFGGWLMFGVGTRALGRSLVCDGRVRQADAMLLDNLDFDYDLFVEAASLLNSGISQRVLVPTIAFQDLNGLSLRKDVAELMGRLAGLRNVETIPVWDREPISLNVAYQVRDVLAKEGVRSVLLLSPAFRSERSFLIYERVLAPVGIPLSCVPVFGDLTPSNWNQTWHGIQDVALQLIKLQYYRFWVLPTHAADRPARRPGPEITKPESKTQYNFADPESRTMKGPDGFVQADNAQVAVDAGDAGPPMTSTQLVPMSPSCFAVPEG